jgi:hypothetical protein
MRLEIIPPSVGKLGSLTAGVASILPDFDIGLRPCGEFEMVIDSFQWFSLGQILTFHKVVKGRPRYTSGHRHLDGTFKFFTENPELLRGASVKISINARITESMLRTWHRRGNTEGQES